MGIGRFKMSAEFLVAALGLPDGSFIHGVRDCDDVGFQHLLEVEVSHSDIVDNINVTGHNEHANLSPVIKRVERSPGYEFASWGQRGFRD